MDLSHNLLRTKADVRALSLNAALRRLRIEGNPFCSTGVRHGTYQIAMQHLLPGMSLLDGKPPSALSTPLSSTLPLPPPPRPPAPGATNHHPHSTRGGGSHRRGASPGRRECGSTREGFTASCPLDFAGDLSVERRWRDSAIAAGRGDPENRKLRQQQQQQQQQQQPCARVKGSSSDAAAAGGGAVGGDRDGGGHGSGIRVTIGGGGPTVAPGSYADMFLTALRKDRSALAAAQASVPDAAGVSNNAASALTLAGRPREASQHQHQHQHQPGHNSAPATALVEKFHRKKRGNDTRAAVAVAAAAEGPATAPTASLLSYRGLSRAERAAARRLAWSQARQEGTVGTARGTRQPQPQRRSNEYRRGGTNTPGGGGENPKKARRTLGARSLEPGRTARGRSSVSRSGFVVVVVAVVVVVVVVVVPRFDHFSAARAWRPSHNASFFMKRRLPSEEHATNAEGYMPT